MSYITKEGIGQLKKRLKSYLETLPNVIEQVSTARAMGDLSENAEYHAAREKQRNLEKDIGFLQSRLYQLKVIDPTDLPKKTIRFGFFVKLLDLKKKSNIVYRLVGPDEVGLEFGDRVWGISYVSPIGAALLGRKRGEKILVKAPAGNLEFEIVEISQKKEGWI